MIDCPKLRRVALALCTALLLLALGGTRVFASAWDWATDLV